jgi:hypothetical protein
VSAVLAPGACRCGSAVGNCDFVHVDKRILGKEVQDSGGGGTQEARRERDEEWG